jgi:hypothetical protein
MWVASLNFLTDFVSSPSVRHVIWSKVGEAGLAMRRLCQKFAMILVAMAVSSCASPTVKAIRGIPDSVIRTYRVEIGRNDEVLARTELGVSREDSSRYSLAWPIVASDFCTDDRGANRRAAASERVTILLEPLKPVERGRKTTRPMRVTGEWREYLGMPLGVESPSCLAFPRTQFASKVSRTVDMNLDNPLTLQGDNGLFLRIVRQ